MQRERDFLYNTWNAGIKVNCCSTYRESPDSVLARVFLEGFEIQFGFCQLCQEI